jgi:hypothetical protein
MKNKTFVVVLLALVLLAGGAVSAFVLFNPPGKWLSGDLPRNITINSNGHSQVNDGDGGVSEIVAAIANWNAVVSGTVTSTSLSGSPPYVIGDGISTMHFNVGGTGCSGGCLAVTFTPIATSGSEVVNGISFGGFTDSDIFFNTRTKFYSSSESDGCNREYHIESVAVHEVGHLLGLDHTPVGSATMYASTGQCNPGGESLAPDDIDGINCIYNNGAGCGLCVPDTLVVDQTNCDQPTSGPNAGDFVVETYVVDNCGNAVASADVTIDIPTSPQGPLSCSGTTSSSGRLGCALANPPAGLYESLVGDVAKAGFGNWTGSECGGVGQPPCGCSITIGGGGCVPTSSKEKGPKCSDGIDNDCDTLIDAADPDC